MTFGMNTYVTRLLYIDSYVYILHEENNAVFILIFKKKKNKTKVPDNINLNNIYTSSCFAESKFLQT